MESGAKRGSEEEDRKIRQLRFVVDLVCSILYKEDLTFEEAQKMIAGARSFALHLFPKKEQTFDLIYGARFRRILVEKFSLS